MTPDEGYQERLRKFIEEDRKRKARVQHNDDEVNYSRLQVRMPLGCWVVGALLAFAAYMLARWLLKMA